MITDAWKRIVLQFSRIRSSVQCRVGFGDEKRIAIFEADSLNGIVIEFLLKFRSLATLAGYERYYTQSDFPHDFESFFSDEFNCERWDIARISAR